MQELGAVLRTVDPRLLYNYIMWRVVMDLVPFLPPPYQVTTPLSPAPPDPLPQVPRAQFRRVLLGVRADRNRWSQCVEWTNKKMGMAVGLDSVDSPG